MNKVITILLVCVPFLTAQAQTPRAGALRTRSVNPTDPTSTMITDPSKWTDNLAFRHVADSLEGQIVRVSRSDRTLVIEESKSKKLYNISLDQDTKLKADRHTELAGIEKLGISDFKPGHYVKITYIGPDPKVLTVRLRRPKS